jgi:prolyl-tRNA synthetase
MFSDADLLGVPIRLIVSPRNLAENVVELVTRDKSLSEKVPLNEVVSRVESVKAQLLADINARVPPPLAG